MSTKTNFENLIKKYDSKNVLASIEALPEQCQDSWKATRKIHFPKNYKKVKAIVVSGMGGSALPAHLIQTSLNGAIKVPFLFFSDYKVPDFVNKNTLFIASSYSGNTAETLSAYREAKRRGAKLMAITSGGVLGKLAKRDKIPIYIFDPKRNPSGEPRYGLGYSTFGMIGLLESAGVLKIKETDVRSAIREARKAVKRFGLEVQKNIAQELAFRLFGFEPILVAAGHLVGNLHILQNQFNETAKQLAVYFPLPELNHHLLEGLQNPRINKKLLKFFFFSSNFYSSAIKKRVKLTEEVVKKNKISFLDFKLTTKTNLGENLELLVFGSFLTFYLAMLNGVDPAQTKWVAYFKKKLKEV